MNRLLCSLHQKRAFEAFRCEVWSISIAVFRARDVQEIDSNNKKGAFDMIFK